MENNTDKRVNFAQIMLAAAEFLLDPADEQKQKAFEVAKSSLIVKSYLTMDMKYAILAKILAKYNVKRELSQFSAAEVEMCLTFSGLLAYTNIDASTSDALDDERFYDIFWASGLGDYILQYCADDYKRLEKMVDRTISIENIASLMHSLEMLDMSDVNESIENFNKLYNGIDKEVVHSLAKIVGANDPMMESIRDKIVASASGMVNATDDEFDDSEEEDMGFGDYFR